MTELSLILGLDLVALLLVAVLVRWVFALEAESRDVRGVVTAVRAALSSFRLRQAKRGGIVLGFSCVALGVVLHSLGGLPGAGLHAGVGVLLGGVLCSVLGQVALGCGTRAATSTAAALRGPSSSVLFVALRGAALVALSIELVVSLVVASTLVVLVLVHGTGSSEWLSSAQLLLGCAALGAVGMGLIVHLSGSAVASAGEAGLHHLDAATQTRFQLEPGSPALVVSALGPHLGPLLTRTQDIATLSILSHVAAVTAVLGAVRGGAAVDPLALLALPLLIRAVGLIASSIALLSVRADDSDDPVVALFRAQLAALVMAAAGVVGSCRWLLADDSWLLAVGVGLLGLLGHGLLAFLVRLLTERGSRMLRAVREAASGNTEAALALGLAFGGVMAALAFASLAVVLSGSLVLGTKLPIGGGILIGITLSLAGYVTTLGFSAALAAAHPVIESACGLASLTHDGARPQTLARANTFDFVASAGGAMAQAQLAGSLAFIGTALGCVFLPQSMPLPTVTHPVLAVAGCAGAAFVIAITSFGLHHGARALGAGASETARQLRSFARDARGVVQLPKDFSPSYKDYLERVSDAALSRLTLPTFVCLAFPLGLGVLTHGWLEADALPLAAATFIGVGGLTSLALSALAGSVGGLFGAARRHSRATSFQHQRSLNQADLFAQTVTSQVASASRLALTGVAAAGLVLWALAA